MTIRMLYLPAALLAAVLLVCAAALLALSEKAEATFPGKNGRIAYALVGNRGGGIYTINPNGSGRTKVTRGIAPSYSPDGEKMAFVGSRREKLYIIELGGGGKTKVADNVDTVRPSWGIRL